MKLVVGLGNPGQEYSKHRHNIGWVVTDAMLPEGEYFEKFSGLMAKAGGNIFFKPTTFMNSSGDAVTEVASYFKIEPKNIIVIHDEMDIPFGEVRVKLGGGHAGHRGVKSVIERLGTPEFYRVRCGIGRPDEGVAVLDHVLGNFKDEDTSAVKTMIQSAYAMTLGLLT